MGEPFCAVFQKIPGIEKIYGEEEEGGGVSPFSVNFFLSHSAEKLRWATF